MVVGIGIDLVEIHRMKQAIERPAFVQRVFTPAEEAYCSGRGRQNASSFAARFAAKEAAMKALGTGLSGGGTWQDIEVLPNEQGKPVMQLTGFFGQLAKELGVSRIHVSLSHAQEYATAQVLLWRGETE
ncbi:MAG TPA: holo-ACP synthase [Negativicutes bacterium]|nr:holo-ACP synthase [Negativicutes bacterium]